ncbi:MAG: rRNA ((1402)-2-O)-methyltransferase [Verrucomicrobiota bacterium]|jgi:16S rRNA (cytidine1402-2'-O)-methyltransferase
MSAGSIHLIPTPIGNRDDITLRSLRILAEADAIACEDTRHSSPLLQHHGIQKPLISLHEHNEIRRIPELIERVRQGEKIAVITDAGMPGISDPGYRLVQRCIEESIPYEVLPGPSAVLNALIGSGFPCHSFSFGGFLSVKKGKRAQVLQSAIASGQTHIFFESPHRLPSTLEILTDLQPQVRVCVARELTKKFETFHRGTAKELHSYFQNHPPKGEIVLLVHGNEDSEI